MRDLGKSLWYKVWLEENGREKLACIDLEKLPDLLPHGSGLDYDWHVKVLRDGTIRCDTDHHFMDENGMYDGTIPVTVWVECVDGVIDTNVRCRNSGKYAGIRDYYEELFAFTFDAYAKTIRKEAA